MKPTDPQFRRRRAQRPVKRQATGSALLMVVVVLFMLAIMGTAYLQYARIQRFAAGTTTVDIDAVVNAAVSQIKGILTDDITYSEKFAPYDYPWTNDAVTRTATLFDGTLDTTAKGGSQDDYWLASSSPVGTTTMSWEHLSNLNGLFLRWNNNSQQFQTSAGVDVTAGVDPGQDVVDQSTPERKDTDLDIVGNNLLFDADRDGIPDSRWTWAPIRQMNGVNYVMAVRIVDLSSLINLNTTLSLVREDDTPDTTAAGDNAPRWDNPSEINLGSFIHGIDSAQMTKLQAMLANRSGAAVNLSTTHPGGPMLRTDRLSFWQNAGRYYPKTASRQPTASTRLYGVDDEYNLRRFNGINVALNKSVPPITVEDDANGLANFLQTSDLQSPWAAPLTSANIQEHFALTGTSSDRRRPSVTVFGGATTLAMPTDLTTATEPQFKLDLNKASTTDIAARITEVFKVNTPTFPAGITAGPTAAAELGERLAACIGSYRRNDNKVVKVGNFYGLAALPFISEVYVHRKYSNTGASATGTTYDINWNAASPTNFTPAFAIEISNPFARPIKLENVQLWVKYEITTDPNKNVPWGALDTLAGVSELQPGKSLILYRNPLVISDTQDTLTITGNVLESTPNSTQVNLGTSVSWPTDAIGNVEFQLRATLEDGTPITAPYQKVISKNVPDAFTETGATATPATGRWQISTRGSGDGIKTLTIAHGGPFPFTADENPPSLSFVGTASKLGTADKGTTGPISASSSTQQVVIANDDFKQVGELMHLAILGFTDTKTVPEIWNYDSVSGGGSNISDVQSLMLDFDPTTAALMDGPAPGDPTSAYHVPHAQFLLDQFTTFDPATDGVDNDGDGVDTNSDGVSDTLIDIDDTDGGEHIIPGLINLNTMSAQLLRRVLPIPDVDKRDQVVDAILAYRKAADPAHRPTNARTAKGIAFTGELFGLIDPLGPTAVNTVLGGDTADNTYMKFPDSTSPTGDVRTDFLSYLPPSATLYTDNITDDRKEAATIARWLSQIGSTRSDHFIAYIVIRAYPSSDMRSTAIIDSRSAMVVFRRNIKTVSGAPRVEVEAVLPTGRSFQLNN